MCQVCTPSASAVRCSSLSALLSHVSGRQRSATFLCVRPGHIPVDPLTQLDHITSVWPSFDGTVWREPVELDSVPVQKPGVVSKDPWNDCIRDVDLDLQHLLQPSSYRNDLSFHQAIRDLKCTHAGRRVLWPRTGLPLVRLHRCKSVDCVFVRSMRSDLDLHASECPPGKVGGPLSTAQANVHADSQSRRWGTVALSLAYHGHVTI